MEKHNFPVEVFTHPQFGLVRISTINGKYYFCLADICKALEIGNPRNVKPRLQVTGVHTVDGCRNITNRYGKTSTIPTAMTFIDEPNLYRCIFQSRKPDAEKFQDWVFEEVLPQIRKTGGYIPVDKKDDDFSILCKAIKIADASIKQKDELIAQLAPKAKYTDDVLICDDCYTMTEMAKELQMTVRELQNHLHNRRIIYRSQSGPFMLYADFCHEGYTKYRTKCSYDLFDAPIDAYSYMVWTEKGRKFLHNVFNEWN